MPTAWGNAHRASPLQSSLVAVGNQRPVKEPSPCWVSQGVPRVLGAGWGLHRGPWGPGHQGHQDTWLSVTQWPGWSLMPPGGAAGPQRGASWTCPRLPGHSPGFPALRTTLIGIDGSGVIINPPGAGSTAQKAPSPLGPHFLLVPRGPARHQVRHFPRLAPLQPPLNRVRPSPGAFLQGP